MRYAIGCCPNRCPNASMLYARLLSMLILVNKPDISKIIIIMFGIALTSVKVMTSKKKKKKGNSRKLF